MHRKLIRILLDAVQWANAGKGYLSPDTANSGRHAKRRAGGTNLLASVTLEEEY